MAWAALLGTGLGMYGSYTQGEANKQQLRDQGNLEQRYEGAANQIGQWDDQGEKSLASDLSGLSGERYGDYGSLAQALGGSGRSVAMQGGRDDMQARLAKSLGVTGAQTQTGAPSWTGGSTGSWYNNAMQGYQPAFDANKNLAVSQAGATAGNNYDQGAYRNLREQETDIGRRAGEAQQREGLMQSGRQRMLQDAGVKFRWKGPSSGYYNQQLLGQGLQLAGSGVQAYGGYQSRQPASGGYTPGNYTDYNSSGGSGASTGSGSSGW